MPLSEYGYWAAKSLDFGDVLEDFGLDTLSSAPKQQLQTLDPKALYCYHYYYVLLLLSLLFSLLLLALLRPLPPHEVQGPQPRADARQPEEPGRRRDAGAGWGTGLPPDPRGGCKKNRSF